MNAFVVGVIQGAAAACLYMALREMNVRTAPAALFAACLLLVLLAVPNP